jgi:hypothetical protein
MNTEVVDNSGGSRLAAVVHTPEAVTGNPNAAATSLIGLVNSVIFSRFQLSASVFNAALVTSFEIIIFPACSPH